jgi:maltose phosphorylase
MAGTWMSIVEGFGGMRIKDDTLHFSPKFQKNGKVFV